MGYDYVILFTVPDHSSRLPLPYSHSSHTRTWEFPRLVICNNCFNDWKTVYGFTRKILALSAFILMIAALFPLFTSAQPDESYRHAANFDAGLQEKVNGMEGSLRRLDKIPEEVAAMRVEVAALQTGQKEQSDMMRYIVLAILGTIGVKFLDVFGVRLIRERKEGPKNEVTIK